jgi:hypothetical protein|tara:strand:+ start:94 stop:342 length:249 start_codon:yes stop_codon:yes gene_type:complete
MKLEEACYSLKLECALRELGFVDIGWKCVAHAGIFFVQPVGIPDDPEADLLGFSLSIPNTKDHRRYKLVSTAKRALDIALEI